ncbi:hypothetical protein OUZ56_002896 [Daphnia magna]|uniref:Uncharacterized protein n=1 Tax=Daphnia magna TaxID=35525 RepID=A0ABR0A743_9CRUS|nr:hypothetical protein OUZ56_002896 [Daphnia magna]
MVHQKWQLGEVLECLKKESPNIVIQQYVFLQQLILHLQPWNELHIKICHIFMPTTRILLFHRPSLLMWFFRIRQYKKFFSRKFMILDLLEMTLETRSFSCFVWTGILEALMSETNKCLANKVSY